MQLIEQKKEKSQKVKKNRKNTIFFEVRLTVGLFVKKCNFCSFSRGKVQKKVQKLKKPDTYMHFFVKNRCFWKSAHVRAENFEKSHFLDKIDQKPRIFQKSWYTKILGSHEKNPGYQEFLGTRNYQKNRSTPVSRRKILGTRKWQRKSLNARL